MLKTYRGRRFLACRARDVLRDVIENLPEGPYSQLAEGHDVREEGLPGAGPGQKEEMRNLTNLLLRMILKANDGRVSSADLRSF